MKNTWKAPWGMPSVVVRRELSTRPLMMSFPNCCHLSALLLLMVGWSIRTLAKPPLMVSFSKVKRKRIQTCGSISASRIWCHLIERFRIP